MGNVRAGHDRLTIAALGEAPPATIQLTSPAFAPGSRLPPRFTADGDGVSPPLVWTGVPEGAASLLLIVEDPDAPAPNPLVHAIVVGIDPASNQLAEGAIVADGDGRDGRDVGRNSYFAEGWLPPDPPTGHGAHDYVFQLFALKEHADDADPTPGRADVRSLLAGNVLAAGTLVGTYSRGEEAPVSTENTGIALA